MIEVITYQRDTMEQIDVAEAETPEYAIGAAVTLIDEAIANGCDPRAAFFVNGKRITGFLSRGEVVIPAAEGELAA